jgi:hypothetical protein
MAYNFRPKSVQEITSKRKLFGDQASLIYEFVKKNYGETIILDPTTNLNKIKVPRSVQEQVNITELKRKIEKSNISLKGIEISFGNGSGKANGGGMDAVETAKQENATRLYCETFVQTSKFPTAAQLKKVYENADDEWIDTFERQAKAIDSYLKTKGYSFSRDQGIMPFVEDVALKKCGVRTKDSWNPADIYCVRKTKEDKIKKDIAAIGVAEIEPAARLDLLNDYMRQSFVKQDLIGISLKKLGKRSVSVEETNVVKKKPLSDIAIIKDSISLNLDLNTQGEFVTGELAFKLQIKDSVVNVQIRAFSGGVRESTQMDMTGSGEAAKLGKVSAQQAIDPFLNTYNLKRRMGTDIPKVGQFTKADIKKYVDEQKALQNITIGGSKISFGKQNWQKTLTQAIQLEQNNNRTASQLSAKLQCFQWLTIFKEIEKKRKLKDFLVALYYGAKKEYDSAGPFLKVS